MFRPSIWPRRQSSNPAWYVLVASSLHGGHCPAILAWRREGAGRKGWALSLQAEGCVNKAEVSTLQSSVPDPSPQRACPDGPVWRNNVSCLSPRLWSFVLAALAREHNRVPYSNKSEQCEAKCFHAPPYLQRWIDSCRYCCKCAKESPRGCKEHRVTSAAAL